MIWAFSLLTKKLISLSLTPMLKFPGIRSLTLIGRLTPPRKISALPPVIIHKASPKAISGRTSYLCVRLEFLRYPQLIPQLFNGGGFGPPQYFTTASSCPWIGHTVSGLLQHTLRSIKTRFPFGSMPSLTLNLACYCKSPVRSTKSTRSLALPPLVYTRFQVLFHSPPGVLFTFPSRYLFTIGHLVVFSLGGWSLLLHTGFLVSRTTPDSSSYCRASLTGLSPSAVEFSKLVQITLSSSCWSLPLACFQTRFGLFPFRSPLLRKSIAFFLFLQVLRCFSSLRSLPYLMCSGMDNETFASLGFPIRTSMAQCLFAAPHGLSQLATSFFGSKCQGIPRVHFLA